MEEKLLQISYDMTLDEIAEGFKLFQNKYQRIRTIIYTFVYLIALGFGIDFIIRDMTNFWGFALIGISVGCIFYSWYRPVAVRKKMISAISELNEETYVSDFYKSKIVINTQIIKNENDEEKSEDTEENVETTLYFGSDLLEAMENEKMFLLFVNKKLIYIYPKRCLSDEQQSKLREIFKSKALL